PRIRPVALSTRTSNPLSGRIRAPGPSSLFPFFMPRHLDIKKADDTIIGMEHEAHHSSPGAPDGAPPGEGHRRLPGFDALKVFCDAARCRNIPQAAADNDLSQPAASLIVRQLEKRLGVQLVNRLKRPLQLTALGQLYYDGCKGLVDQYLDLE